MIQKKLEAINIRIEKLEGKTLFLLSILSIQMILIIILYLKK
jgi:hypothetical protein